MPKGGGTGGYGGRKKAKAAKAARSRSSANKRPVVNIGSDSSRTRLRGASNTASNRKKVAAMKAKKKYKTGGGSRGY